jgi:hypothetical protein
MGSIFSLCCHLSLLLKKKNSLIYGHVFFSLLGELILSCQVCDLLHNYPRYKESRVHNK